jgi:hypothetical protein
MNHQTVTIPNDSTKAFTNIQQAINHFLRQPANNTTNETEIEDPPAPPYTPSPDNENPPTPPYIFHSAHFLEYHLPDIQPTTEPVIPSGDSSHEDTHGTEEGETPQTIEDDSSERYWHVVDTLD